MEDLISRQAAIDLIHGDKITGDALDMLTTLGEGRLALTLNDACDRHIQGIKKLPPVQSERKNGRWILAFNGQFIGGAYWFYCSKCEIIVPEVRNGGWNFCPQCGADMREEMHGEDL